VADVHSECCAYWRSSMYMCDLGVRGISLDSFLAIYGIYTNLPICVCS
jgi:hypothetical protein